MSPIRIVIGWTQISVNSCEPHHAVSHQTFKAQLICRGGEGETLVTDCFMQFVQSICELAILPSAHVCQIRVRAVRARKGSALPWTVFCVSGSFHPQTLALRYGSSVSLDFLFTYVTYFDQ